MRAKTLVFSGLAGLLLVAAAKPKAPEPSDEVLVLGVRGADGALSTWVGDPTGLTRVGSGLAVPRPDGWWRLERVVRESKGSKEARVFAWKSGQKFTPPPLDVEEGCESDTAETLLFAGPGSFSVEIQSSGDCEGAAHGYASTILRTLSYEDGSRTADRPVDRVFGEGAAKAWRAAAAVAHGGEEKRQLDCLADADANDVALVRQKGRWILRGELNYAAEACRGRNEYFTVDTTLAEAITGPDRLPGRWEDVLAFEPDAIDAVFSPTSRLRVIVTKDGFVLADGPQKVVKVDQPGSAIVLAQWALGKNAAKWRAEVPKALSAAK